ncbi:hypothetical protein IJ798_01490 [Candidatus Saccharibacteria bacterium]|nr:hypothetical protein [Candidatus Saccharibacteria bacterium]
MAKRGKNQKIGKIIKIGGVKTWPHEDHTAEAFAKSGYTVKFIPAHNQISSADAYINNTLFEFKSPDGDNIGCVDNNLKKALRKQSKCVVIDTIRIKKVLDRSIKNYLLNVIKKRLDIKRLYMVTKKGEVIDIKNPLR